MEAYVLGTLAEVLRAQGQPAAARAALAEGTELVAQHIENAFARHLEAKFKRLQQATASGEQGPIYKEAAAQQLAALAQPCAPKVGESLPAAKAGAAKGQQPARAPAASPKTGLDPAAAWPFPTGSRP